MEAKRALRTRLRAARTARSDADRVAAAAALAQHGQTAIGRATTVAAYASIRDEPPTEQLIECLTGAGIRVLLPRVTGQALEWAAYVSSTELSRSGLGVLEPTGPAVTDALAKWADLVLVPALAVDRRGNRLGRGAGFYDRALASVPRNRLVAVVYADEILARLPTEPHDVAVRAALTPEGIVELDDQ
jgi:5-formyltetrahydrofolate cyclo-ligase